jgi:hypothetical protein
MEFEVRTIKDFQDNTCGVMRKVNEIFTCTEDRYNVLNGMNPKREVVVELIGIKKKEAKDGDYKQKPKRTNTIRK